MVQSGVPYYNLQLLANEKAFSKFSFRRFEMKVQQIFLFKNSEKRTSISKRKMRLKTNKVSYANFIRVQFGSMQICEQKEIITGK